MTENNKTRIYTFNTILPIYVLSKIKLVHKFCQKGNSRNIRISSRSKFGPEIWSIHLVLKFGPEVNSQTKSPSRNFLIGFRSCNYRDISRQFRKKTRFFFRNLYPNCLKSNILSKPTRSTSL